MDYLICQDLWEQPGGKKQPNQQHVKNCRQENPSACVFLNETSLQFIFCFVVTFLSLSARCSVLFKCHISLSVTDITQSFLVIKWKGQPPLWLYDHKDSQLSRPNTQPRNDDRTSGLPKLFCGHPVPACCHGNGSPRLKYKLVSLVFYPPFPPAPLRSLPVGMLTLSHTAFAQSSFLWRCCVSLQPSPCLLNCTLLAVSSC